MKHILILEDAECKKNSLNALSLLSSLGNSEICTVSLLSIGEPYDEAIGHFQQIVCVPHRISKPSCAREITHIIKNLYDRYAFDMIIVPTTDLGLLVAPRVAKRLKASLTSDVVELRKEKEGILLIRTAYSGNMLAGIRSVGRGPIMMTVNLQRFSYSKKPSLHTTMTMYQKEIPTISSIRCIKKEKKVPTYDIRKSSLLVSGGGGIKKQDYHLLEKLAHALGGEVSVSRKLVDKGIAPRDIQVGQSGKIVTPKLYFALGIEGAIQHVEGLKHIETIISVNTSSRAPICSLSDIVVEGDAKSFIEKLLNTIERNRDNT